MIKIIYLLLPIILVSCVSPLQQKMDACTSLSYDLKKDNGWIEQCMANQEVYDGAFIQLAKKSAPEEVCESIESVRGTYQEAKLQSVAEQRKINCSKYREKKIRAAAQSASVNQLCHVWFNGSSDPMVKAEYLNEIKSRKVDCQQIASMNTQKEQAILNRKLNLYALESAHKNTHSQSFPKSVNTNCVETWNGVNCTSNYNGGIDTTVFGRVKSIQDYQLENEIRGY